MTKFYRQIFFLEVLVAILIGFVWFGSCGTFSDSNAPKPFMSVYYFLGSIETEFPCEGDIRDFAPDLVDKGTVTMSQDEFYSLQRLMSIMERAGENKRTYTSCLQCYVYAGDSVRRFTFGQSGPVNINAKSFQRNDTLVYMLRKHAGFYNHYSQQDLETYDQEVQKFGLPDGYQDLSEQPEFTRAFAAHVKIQVE